MDKEFRSAMAIAISRVDQEVAPHCHHALELFPLGNANGFDGRMTARLMASVTISDVDCTCSNWVLWVLWVLSLS